MLSFGILLLITVVGFGISTVLAGVSERLYPSVLDLGIKILDFDLTRRV